MTKREQRIIKVLEELRKYARSMRRWCEEKGDELSAKAYLRKSSTLSEVINIIENEEYLKELESRLIEEVE